MFKNCTCLSSNYSLCTKIYFSLIQMATVSIPWRLRYNSAETCRGYAKSCRHKW